MEIENKIPKEILKLSDENLREAIKSLQNVVWDEDDLLRTLAIKIHRDDTVMNILMLAIPLAIELEKRTAFLIQ